MNQALNQSIPNTDNIEVATIAAAIRIAEQVAPGSGLTPEQILEFHIKNFATVYTAINKAVREGRE